MDGGAGGGEGGDAQEAVVIFVLLGRGLVAFHIFVLVLVLFF